MEDFETTEPDKDKILVLVFELSITNIKSLWEESFSIKSFFF